MQRQLLNRLVAIITVVVWQLLTALRGDSRCSNDLTTCPPGHQMSICPSGTDYGYYCEKCASNTFQPDVNKFGDRCSLRKSCARRFMRERDPGSSTRDAHCQCISGFHFLTEDQNACVPNEECPIGYGQGAYGVCEECYTKGGYSDQPSRKQKCQKLTDCRVQSKCLVKSSDGSKDNQCSAVVDDLSQCQAESAGTQEGIIIGCVMGFLVIFIIVFVALMYKRNRQRRYKSWINGEKTDDVIRALMEISRKDNTFTSNVLEKSCFLIEEKIPKQEWALAQELFRGHEECSKYEDLLIKYKGQTQKEATRGYLEEWRKWKGDIPESIAILFQCLRKVDRDDIVIMICKQFRHEPDVEMNTNAKTSLNNQPPKYSLCPCQKQPKNDEGGDHTDETKPLQSAPDVIVQMYPALSTPSAPEDDSLIALRVSNSNLTIAVQATNS